MFAAVGTSTEIECWRTAPLSFNRLVFDFRSAIERIARLERNSPVRPLVTFGLSMREFFKNCLTRNLCGRFLVGLASFVFVLVISCSHADAAGCVHPEQRASDLPDGIARIYENGRFYYYKIVPPCSGPKCGRSKPTSMAALPSAISNERSNSLTFITGYPVYSAPKPVSLLAEIQSSYASPSFDEPLRPPV